MPDNSSSPTAVAAHAAASSLQLIDYFVHSSRREGTEMLNRTRILAASIVAICACALGALIAILATGFSSLSNGLATLVILPLSALQLHALLRLKRQGAYRYASLTVIGSLFVALLAGISVSGGPLHSPVTYELVIPVLIAYFFGGRPLGTRMTLVTVFTLVFMFALSTLGLSYPQTISEPHRRDILHLLVSCQNLAAIATMAFIYEYTAAALKRERDREHQRYIHLARTDALTGLANRRNFDDVLAERMRLYVREQPVQRFALGYLDLDGFKPINDQYGHAVGDEVLCVIAERLRNTLRGVDFVGRHGGDEFMLLIDKITDQTTLEFMAERLLASIAQPIQTSAGPVQVSGSLGFALFPLDAGEIEALKHSADAAMYDAKKQRGTWRFHRQPPTAPSQEAS